MAKKKKISQKQRFAFILIALIVGFIGILQLFYQLRMYQDRERASILKSDILSLKNKLEAVTPGWKYKEECYAQGGKSSPNKPSSCTLRLNNLNAEKIQLSVFTEQINNYESFKLIGEDRSYYDSYDRTGDEIIAHSFKPNYLDEIVCEIIQNKDTGATELYCRFPANDFYFERTR